MMNPEVDACAGLRAAPQLLRREEIVRIARHLTCSDQRAVAFSSISASLSQTITSPYSAHRAANRCGPS